MRLLLSILCCVIGALAQPITWGTTKQLDNGVYSVKIYDWTTAGGRQTSDFVPMYFKPPAGAVYMRATFHGTNYERAGSVTSCTGDPCEVDVFRGYGSPRVYVQFFASGDVAMSNAGVFEIPQSNASQTCVAQDSLPLPLEVVGFAPLVRCVSDNLEAGVSTSGTIRLWAKTHRITYPTKARVRTNSNAWLNVQRSNVTLLHHARNYNFSGSMDFSQDVLWWTMDLPAGSVVSGANTISWQFAKEEKEQSGYRVLDWNFLRPAVTCASQSINSAGLVTLTCAGHGLTTGNDVLIDNFPGVAWRINGEKNNVTVVDANTITFSVSNPKSISGSWTYSGVTVSRFMIDRDTRTQEDPSTWTAPSSTNSATGDTLFDSSTLLAPTWRGYSITASCASCHAKDGRDLKYFAFSNRSIEVRSQFHGMSYQESRDIAAYVRANTSSVPGRAWYSPYQPCPAADTASAYDWSGSCSEEEVLPNEMGMLEQLASNGTTMTTADWSPTRKDIHFRNARISFQLLGLFEWWPRIYPGDVWTGENCGVYDKGCFATSDLKVGYDQIYEDLQAYCPGTGTQCQDRIAALGADGRRQPSGKKLVNFRAVYGQSPTCVGNPADVDCSTRFATEQNQELVKTYSAAQWDVMKAWEVDHIMHLNQYGLTWYPDGGSENDRIGRYGNFFNSSPNLMRARLNNAMVGILDGSGDTEKFVSMQWYHLQGVVLSNKNKCCANQNFDGIQPIDVSYTYGYFFDLNASPANVDLPLVHALWLQQNFIRYENTTPANSTNAKRWDLNILRPYIFTQQNFQDAFAVIPSSDRDAVRTNLVDTSLTKWTSIFCGDEANGTASPFTSAEWNASGGRYDPVRYPIFPSLFSIGGTGNEASAVSVAHAMAFGGAYGLNQTARDRLATCGAAIWQGPSSTLNGAIDSSQTTLVMASSGTGWPTVSGTGSPVSNIQLVIDSERITCTTRSGSNFSGCTRGADGTTQASHSNGATVQMRIRWTKYSTVSCPKTGDSVNCDGQDLYP